MPHVRASAKVSAPAPRALPPPAMWIHPSSLPFLLALGFAAGGCTGPKSGEGGRMVAETELPERYRQAVAAWKQDGPAWREIRQQALEDPPLATFLVDNLIDVMVESYTRALISAPGELAGPFERARADLVYLHDYSGPMLIELVLVGDNVVSFLAADTLAEMKDPALSPPVARRLSDPERESRRRAAELLGRLPNALDDEPEVIERLGHALAQDPEWAVRAQAVLAMGERGQRVREVEKPRRHISGALSDPDPAVVEAACRALSALGDPRAIPALISLLERVEDQGTRLTTQRAAQSALMKLSGSGSQRPAREWRAWYAGQLRPPG
jgi:hypothetical protein